jgi:pimeloyl-ACP methyl ester carboxylesterase
MSSLPPLIFIHGASCDRRVWQFGFLQEFARRGWNCRAIDLPGHGALRIGADLHRLRLDDYVDAIAAAVAECAEPPVLIGHSMGGYLAQRFVLEGGRAQAMVLLASAPPQGMVREILSFALHHPLLAFRLDLAGGHGELDARMARARGMMMTEQTPDAIVAAVAELLQPESTLALRDLSLQSLPAQPLSIPLMCIAGALDRLVSVEASRAMARLYGVEAQIQPGMAHMLQVEPGWERISLDILGFLRAYFPARDSGATKEQVGAA